jgi:hypothetical protein
VNATPERAERPERAAGGDSRRRSRNVALLIALFAFVVLIYLVTIVRMGGG